MAILVVVIVADGALHWSLRWSFVPPANELAFTFQYRRLEGLVMDAFLDNCYVVYIRADHNHADRPESAEQPLASCASYGDARKLCQILHDLSRKSVIRFQGMTGGGD